MLAAIGFDDEPRLVTNEIRDIRPNGHLAPEFRLRELPVAQDAPQPMFRVRHIVAEVSRPV